MPAKILRKNRLRLRDCYVELAEPFYLRQEFMFKDYFNRNLGKEEIGSYQGRRVVFADGYSKCWRRFRDAAAKGSQSKPGFLKQLNKEALSLFKLRMSPGYVYPSKAEVIELIPEEPFVESEPTKPLVISQAA